MPLRLALSRRLDLRADGVGACAGSRSDILELPEAELLVDEACRDGLFRIREAGMTMGTAGTVQSGSSEDSLGVSSVNPA